MTLDHFREKHRSISESLASIERFLGWIQSVINEDILGRPSPHLASKKVWGTRGDRKRAQKMLNESRVQKQ